MDNPANSTPESEIVTPTPTASPSPTPRPTQKPTPIPTPKPTQRPAITSQPTARPQAPGNTSVRSFTAPVNTNTYSCDCSKACTRMVSCEEAYYQLNTCGCSARDGDDDGVPCETICPGG